MVDIFSREKRSEIMRKIGRNDTPKEMMVRKFLFQNGFRFRKNYKILPGSPDIVLPKYNIVIFVHGCFWHGHNCKAGRLPKSNLAFWGEKIRQNKNRDRRKNYQLKKMGWKILHIWQCSLSDELTTKNRFTKLLKQIKEADQIHTQFYKRKGLPHIN
jgi:DNA mismatch endonuclease (patch repair protein)